MSQFSGNINIVNSNTNVFTNTLCNDMVIYTSNNTQRIVIGTSNVGSVVINSNNAWFTGSLGVGAAAPAYTLDVAGTTAADSARVTGNLILGGAANNYFKGAGIVANQAGQVSDISGAGSIGMVFVSGGNVAFGGAGTEFMRLTSTGRLGIGTASPSYKLHVAMGSMFVGDVANTGASSTTPASGYQLVFDNTYNASVGSGANCNKIVLFNNNTGMFGFGLEPASLTYQSFVNHRFYTGCTSSVYGTQVLSIGSNVCFKKQINLTDIVSTTDTITWPVASFSGGGGLQGETITNSTYDWGLIKFPTTSTASVFGRTTVGTHADTTVDQGFFSSSSTPLLVTKGGTGDTYIRGNLGLGTATPGANLHLYGATGVPAMILQNNNGNGIIGMAYGAGGYSTTAGAGDLVIKNTNRVLIQSGGGAAAIVVNTNNFVAIGSANSTYPLSVSGASSGGAGNAPTWYAGNTTISAGQNIPNISLYVGGYVFSTAGFTASSDRRIKTNIQQAQASNIVPIVKYELVDKSEGSGKKWGVVAQEIEELYPEAVKTCSEFIPSVYKIVPCTKKEDGWLLETDAFEKGDHIRCVLRDGKFLETDVVGLVNGAALISTESELGNEVFVYGKKVNDFKTIDYNQLTCIALSLVSGLRAELSGLKAELGRA